MGEVLGEQKVSGKSVNSANNLNALFVKSIRKPGKYHDGNRTGLYLRVDKNGAKFWIQRIVVNGKRCELGLGSPPITSLASARDAALENKRIVVGGGDPIKVKRMARSIPTFKDAAYKVYELNRPTWSNPKHASQFINTLETYAIPKLGHLKVSDITPADIMTTLTPFWTAKPETARRVKQRLSLIFRWTVAQGYRDYDPAQTVREALPRQSKVRKHRKALHYSEVAGCIRAVQNSKAGKSTKFALELLILTASRSSEIRNARWEEFELESGPRTPFPIWRIPRERMKSKREHIVPLSHRAIAILEASKSISDSNGLVFPGARLGSAISDMTLSKLVKSLGYDVDVHGFRTSFKTWAQEQTDFENEVSEMALAHTVRNKVEAAYARSNFLDKRKTMMEEWALYINST